MEIQQKLALVQNTYAAACVDTVMQLAQEGILVKVMNKKDQQRTSTAPMINKLYDVKTPQDVFIRLSDIFGCAEWEIKSGGQGLCAETKCCKMHAIAAKLGSPAPCNLYCLDPMRSMINALDEKLSYKVKSTLFNSDKCCVIVEN